MKGLPGKEHVEDVVVSGGGRARRLRRAGRRPALVASAVVVAAAVTGVGALGLGGGERIRRAAVWCVRAEW